MRALLSLDLHQTTLLSKAIAVARIALGVTALLAPRPLTSAIARSPSEDAVVAWRMVGGRDLALGLGALLAARRGPGALRGWVEAGALADAADVVAFAAGRSMPASRRVGTVILAGGATGAGLFLARQLGGR